MVRLELAMQLLQPRCRLVEAAPGEDMREGCLRRLGAWPRVLRDVAERAAAQHQPSLGVVLAGEHLEEARLAGPVAADEPDLVAGGHGEARVGQNPARRDVDGEVADLEHESGCYPHREAAFGLHQHGRRSHETVPSRHRTFLWDPRGGRRMRRWLKRRLDLERRGPLFPPRAPTPRGPGLWASAP